MAPKSQLVGPTSGWSTASKTDGILVVWFLESQKFSSLGLGIMVLNLARYALYYARCLGIVALGDEMRGVIEIFL